jgi:hypothetical protein
MLCGAPRIRKMTWGFSVRCCQACLESHTLPDYRMAHDHSLPAELWRDLSHTTCGMYAPRISAYTLRLYWKADVLPHLQRVHGDAGFEAYRECKERGAPAGRG